MHSPLASSTLFQRSFALPAPGALPYLCVASLLATGLPNAPTVAGENKRELINLPCS